jgi:hypothetical protein
MKPSRHACNFSSVIFMGTMLTHAFDRGVSAARKEDVDALTRG